MTEDRRSRCALTRRRVLALVLGSVLAASIPSGLRAGTLYWTAAREFPEYLIRRSGLDGSGLEDLSVKIEGGLGGIDVDANAERLYWIENGETERRIVRAQLDGSEREVLMTTESYLSRIDVDPSAGAVYFTASLPTGGAGIHRMDLAGGDARLVISVETSDFLVDGVQGWIYRVQEGAQGSSGTDIWRSLLDGSEQELVAHHRFEHHTTGIALDSKAGKIYWATVDYTSQTQLVQSANVDGSEVSTLTTANSGLDDWPVFLDLDLADRRLYWVNGEDGVFYRMSLDGGEAEELFEDPGAYGPFDIVILPTSEIPPLPIAFRRGDANGDGVVDIADPIRTLGTLFSRFAPFECGDAADADDDGTLSITDAVLSLIYLFRGDRSLPPPGPTDCGLDPTPLDSPGCIKYESCSA
jgi:hypothetical protein